MAVAGSLLFTVKMPFRHETTWQLPRRGEKKGEKKTVCVTLTVATDWKNKIKKTMNLCGQRFNFDCIYTRFECIPVKNKKAISIMVFDNYEYYTVH